MRQAGKQFLISVVFILLGSIVVVGQTKPAPTSTPIPQPRNEQREPTFELGDFGVSFQPDPRLIVVMAALDAAGFDPMPAGREPSVFRAKVRKDQAELDPKLRENLRNFYERNRLPAPATAAEQAARYVSLAFVLGQPPTLEAPERSEDLPAGVLEVLDFAPLIREFYRRSGIDERLTGYMRAYQSEGDRMRAPTAALIKSVVSYLHTRPITTSGERVAVRPPAGKKNAPKAYTIREHDRHFYIVPDLLAAPGTINLRVIADDYYTIVPDGTDPTASELRRAYLQYVVDPLMLRFNKDIAARREPLRKLLKERETSEESVTPDVFIAVARSLVGAADARYSELVKIQRVTFTAREKQGTVKTDTERAAIGKEAQASIAAIKDETTAQLADEYERGAILAFFFAEQLQGIEASGFDIANFFSDMMASFDPAREAKRSAEYAEARARVKAAREERLAARKAEVETPVYSEAERIKANALIKSLSDVEQLLQQRDYRGAETRLIDLMKEYPGDARIFFALAHTHSVGAADATDEDVQAQRLKSALTNYRLAVAAASPETDRALASRAHEAMGRIHAFLDQKNEAANEFDAAIKIGDVMGGAYKAALEGKKKLEQP
ncbi:MAG TPA: hypothetical protein VN643_12955 [Pyrinomonadaceae bacterium]|nr:hypothetical protein [Pyrinomonadaceae bacterium]